MSNGFRVLAHVENLPDQTRRALAGTEPKVPGFPEWLDVEHPRHSFLSEEIATAATEYGVADASRIHATFKSQPEAEAARERTRTVVPEVTIDVPAEEVPA